MKPRLLLITALLIICAIFAFLTNRSAAYVSIASDGDTIKYYTVSIEYETVKNRKIYRVDGRRVTKETYDKYNEGFEAVVNCKPCYARAYSKDEKLLYEGDMYQDCPIGLWREYYPNGKIKTEGHYSGDSTGVYALGGGWCAKRNGDWTYYNTAGEVDSVVSFVNNVRMTKK